MTKNKRFKVAVYDDKAINGFAVLDLQKPNSSKRLEYENVYIGSKAGCEIVCNFGNNLADENEELKDIINEFFNMITELDWAKKEYCNALIRILGEENDVDKAKQRIKELKE